MIKQELKDHSCMDRTVLVLIWSKYGTPSLSLEGSLTIGLSRIQYRKCTAHAAHEHDVFLNPKGIFPKSPTKSPKGELLHHPYEDCNHSNYNLPDRFGEVKKSSCREDSTSKIWQVKFGK